MQPNNNLHLAHTLDGKDMSGGSNHQYVKGRGDDHVLSQVGERNPQQLERKVISFLCFSLSHVSRVIKLEQEGLRYICAHLKWSMVSFECLMMDIVCLFLTLSSHLEFFKTIYGVYNCNLAIEQLYTKHVISCIKRTKSCLYLYT
jgi:hypothetical protein